MTDGYFRRLTRMLENPLLRSRLTAFVGEGEDDGSGDEGGEGDGSPPTTGGTAPKTTPRTPAAAGGTDDSDADDENTRINQITKARLQRDRLTRAKKAGFDTYEEMEAAATRQRKADESSYTEIQKLSKENKTLSAQQEELASENRRLRLDLEMARLLAKEYPDFAGHEEWIMPRLLQDLTDDDWADEKLLGKKVSAIVKAYVEKAGGAGAGGQGQRTGRPLGTGSGPSRGMTGAGLTPSQVQAESIGRGYLRQGAARLAARFPSQR